MLTDETSTSSATVRGRFCTCSEVPASVEPAVTPSVEEVEEEPVDARPYCSCGAGAVADEIYQTEPEAEQADSYDSGPATASESVEDEPAAAARLSALEADETESAMLEAEDGDFVLTDRRVLFKGGSGSSTLWASIALDDVASVRVDRTGRGLRGWFWFALGLVGTIGTWQMLDGGGWVRMLFPGIVAVATLTVLVVNLLAVPRHLFAVVGRNGDRIESGVSNGALEDADEFGGHVTREARASRCSRSADPE